jgi:hypothetical protein
VAGSAWDPQGEAQVALRTIVADPQYGPAALSSSQTMTNLLKDLLPDAPREASVLVAASEMGVADSLRNYVSQGMDLGTASRLAAGSFENRTAMTPEACAWAVGALATALRLDTHDIHDAATRAANVPPRGQVVAPPEPAAGSDLRRLGGGTLAAAVLSVVGAVLILWACALPDVELSGGSGRQSFSIFNTGSGGTFWFAVEPIGVAIVVVATVLLLLFVARPVWLRALAPGMLVAFGIQCVLLFVGYEFSVLKPNHAGPGAAAGVLGGLLLLVAGLLAGISRRASAPVTPNA